MSFSIHPQILEDCGWIDPLTGQVDFSGSGMPATLQSRLNCDADGCQIPSATVRVDVDNPSDKVVGQVDYNGACNGIASNTAREHPRVCRRNMQLTDSLNQYCAVGSQVLITERVDCDTEGFGYDITDNANADTALDCDPSDDTDVDTAACPDLPSSSSDTGEGDVALADTNHTGLHLIHDTGALTTVYPTQPPLHFKVDPSESFISVTDPELSTSLTYVGGFLLASVDTMEFLYGGVSGSSMDYLHKTFEGVGAGFSVPIVVDASSGTFTLAATDLDQVWWSGKEVGATEGVTYYVSPDDDAAGSWDNVNSTWELDFTETRNAGTITVHLEGTYTAASSN